MHSCIRLLYYGIHNMNFLAGHKEEKARSKEEDWQGMHFLCVQNYLCFFQEVTKKGKRSKAKKVSEPTYYILNSYQNISG